MFSRCFPLVFYLGGKKYQKGFLLLVVHGFRRPHTARPGNPHLMAALLRPVHEILRLPHDDAPAPVLLRLCPASACLDPQIRGDHVDLTRLRIPDQKRIPHAAGARMGIEYRISAVQVLPVQPVLTHREINLLPVLLFSNKMCK